MIDIYIKQIILIVLRNSIYQIRLIVKLLQVLIVTLWIMI